MVEVVKGAVGLRLRFFFSIFSTIKVPFLAPLFKTFSAAFAFASELIVN